MTASAQTEQAENLLRSLLVRFISFPHHLELERKAFRGAATWTITCHPDDYGKINGKGGTHLRALEFLVYRLGLVNSEAYGLRLVDSEFRIDGGTAFKDTVEANLANACELLQEWLTALQSECTIVTVASLTTRDSYKFELYPRGPSDYGDLIAVNSNDVHERSLIGSLGTIYRAIGRAAGIDLTIEVKNP
jgi:predicted RNA-binding protein YlqC (UPF0109 family)